MQALLALAQGHGVLLPGCLFGGQEATAVLFQGIESEIDVILTDIDLRPKCR